MRVPLDEVIRQDLHIAREHQEVWIVLPQQSENILLCRSLVIFRDWHRAVRNTVELRNRFVVRMIGNDEWDLAVQFSGSMTIQQINQAVIVLGYKDHHPLPN